MSLDFFMVAITVLTIPFFLALYVALRKINESFALLALVFGMFSCLLVLTVLCRPESPSERVLLECRRCRR